MSDIKDFKIKNGVLIKYKGTDSDVVIPDGVTSIDKNAFCECKHLQSIVIPDTVTSIGYCAFTSCNRLKHVTLPESITHIGDWAFSRCKGLQSITLSKGLTHIGWALFYNCTSLKSINIPEGVTKIALSAFMDCKALQDITIPESVTHIDDSVFVNCKALKNLTIPQSVTHIGECVFQGCKGMADANGMIIIRDVLYDYLGKETDVTFPDGIRNIGSAALHKCETVQNVVIPEGVTSIGYHAFTYCSNLQTIKIPDSVTDISMWAFHYCDNLKSISIGNGIRHLGREVFPGQMLHAREWILAPESKDEEQAFMLIDKIGTQNLALSFLSGTMITNPILYQKLQNRITNKKFREQFLPVLIEKHETEAIAKMLSLISKMSPDEIDMYIGKSENNPEIRSMLLNYKNKLYPPEILEKMDEIQTEKDFGLREKTLADYKKIFSIKKENGIYVITKYKGTCSAVTIPAQIRGIPVQFSLRKCATITDVFLEDGHTGIGTRAFEDCSDLRNIAIPRSVAEISPDAFSGCEYLTIHAPKGSYAQIYAKENLINFQPLDPFDNSESDSSTRPPVSF